MRTREERNGAPPEIRLGATVVAQPLIGNFNIFCLLGGFMAARVAASLEIGLSADQRPCASL